MTWMTPLLAWTSVATTATSLPAASVNVTDPSSATPTVMAAPLTVVTCLAVEPDDVGSGHRPGHHVVGEDVGQVAGRIFEQRLDGACWQGGERVVGRSEDRERSLAAQRVLEPGRLNGGDERGEVAGGDRRVDDVGVGRRRRWRGHRRLRGGRHGGGGRWLAWWSGRYRRRRRRRHRRWRRHPAQRGRRRVEGFGWWSWWGSLIVERFV